jgi:AMP-binding enzyme family protein
MSENKQYTFHTSGSSGEPKIIKKSYECVLAEGQDLAEFFKFSPDTVFVSTVTPDFMYGTTFTVMLPKVLGCKVDEERVLYPEDIKDYEKYVFVSTPSFLEKLAKYNFTFKHKPQMIISAGAKLADDVFEYLEKISLGVTEIYGSTEAGVIAYRQCARDNLKFFENVTYKNNTIKSPYFDEAELTLNDEIEFLQNGFVVKKRNDRIVKIQEKRVSLSEVENILNASEFVEKSYCLKLDNKLCAAAVLTAKGQKFLEEKGKLELIKLLKMSGKASLCKKWRFLHDLPVTERGKINRDRITEIFNTNITYPNIIDFSINSDFAEFKLVFPISSNFFKGHFTDFPILPGVVQLFFAKEFIKDAFNLDFVPETVKKIKFSSVIKPDTKVTLTLKRKEKSIDFMFTNGDITFSSGSFVL